MNERKDILERVKHLMKENSEIKERFNGSEMFGYKRLISDEGV